MTIHKQRLLQARFGGSAGALTGPPPVSIPPRRFWSPADRLAWLAALVRQFMQWVRAFLATRTQAGATRPIALTGRRALLALIAEREHLTEILLIIPSAGIAVLTYYGVALPLTETGSTVVQKGQAVGFALTIGVFAWLAWFYLFGLIHRLTGRRLRDALLAGGVMVGSIALIDAPFNMLALAGGPAAQMSLVDMTLDYERQRAALIARVTATRRLVPAIKVQAARFDSLRAQEEKSGTFSGKAAPGKVSASFGQVGGLLGGLDKELEGGLAKADALQTDLTTAFADLKGFAYREGPIRSRMEGAAAAGDRIDALLAQAAQYDFAASITATLASLDASLPRVQGGGGDAFAQSQAAAVTAIAGMVRPVADALRAGLGELQTGGAATAFAPRRPESPLIAIRTYWRELFPHWCAALFIDLAPAALLVLLIAARRESERGDREAASDLEPAPSSSSSSSDQGDAS